MPSDLPVGRCFVFVMIAKGERMNMERRIKTTTWLLAALLLLATGFAFSQGTPASAGSASQAAGGTQSDARAQLKEALTKISTELNLTDDQKAKIKPILQSEFSQLKTVRDDTSMSPDQKQAKATDIHDSASTQISSILTPEQQKKWESMKQSFWEEHQ